jgi:hypothetical protein
VGTSTKSFWVQNKSGAWTQITTTLRAQREHSNVWLADINYDNASSGNKDNKLTTAQMATLAQKFDTMYVPETALFGYEYGGDPKDVEHYGGVDGDPRVQILVYDIDYDYSSNQTSGTLGYFWEKDEVPYSPSQYDKSNECEMFYLDAYFIDAYPAWQYSTLAHEFQHMIHYNEKKVKQGKESSTWYNEMLSMLAEDTIDPKLNLPVSDDGHPVSARIPTFLSTCGDVGIMEWASGRNVLKSYAMAYAFGAYLVRNYGGAQLIADLMATNNVDKAAIDAVLASRNSSFTDALGHFGEALFYSSSKGKHTGTKSYDNTVTETVGGQSYTFQGFDVWTMRNDSGSTGPLFHASTAAAAIPAYSITAHRSPNWENVTGSLMIQLTKPASDNVQFYLIKQ